MGFRRRRRRYRPSRRRGQSGSRSDAASPIEELAEVIIWGTGACVRGLARLVVWLCRLAFTVVRADPARPAVSWHASHSSGGNKAPVPPTVGTRAGAIPARTRWPGIAAPNPHRYLTTSESARATVELPYEPVNRLLSKGERAFWYPLYRAVRGKYRIFCKVRLADVVRTGAHRKDERRWFRKISSYHVDFVICQPRTTAPLLVIELDDRSHRSKTREERDEFKEEVLAAAGLPIYRVSAQQAYDPVELGLAIDRLIDLPRETDVS
jgi:hypothetical protein